MRTIYETDTTGKKWPVRVPETEEERRKLQAETRKARGGIGNQSDWDDEEEDANWSDD